MPLPTSVARALSTQPDRHRVEIGGVRVEYLAWNPRDATKPALLFAHGNRGHAYWWSPIAPFFTDRFRVYALNFSGMGNSGWRPHYDHSVYTQDMLGVLDHVGAARGYLVGHSFGGSMVLRAAATAPDRIIQACIVDTYVRFADSDPKPTEYAPRQARQHADYAAIRARYRLTPLQPIAHPELVEHIARHSAHEVAGHWCWKFDPAMPTAPGVMDGDTILSTIEVPTHYIYGELSAIVDAQRAARIAAALRQNRTPLAIPDAYHHVMLDQPLALVTALRALLT